jgi:hypothetical protein
MKNSVYLNESLSADDQVERDTIEILKVGHVDYISQEAMEFWAAELTHKYMVDNNIKFPSPSLPDYQKKYNDLKFWKQKKKSEFKNSLEVKQLSEIKVKYTIVHYDYRDKHYQLVIKLNPMDENTLKNIEKGYAHDYELHKKVKEIFNEFVLDNIKIDHFYFDPTIVEN